MGKKKTTAAMKADTAPTAPTDPPKEAGLFDATAYEKELAALQEKHTTALKAAIAEATAKRDEAENALAALESTLNTILGRTAPVRGAARASGGKRTRMTKDQIADLEAQAVAFIGSAKEGVSRSQVAERLALEPAKAATILKALKEGGKVKTEGTKSQTRWFAK